MAATYNPEEDSEGAVVADAPEPSRWCLQAADPC
jgi:hypothetical protein